MPSTDSEATGSVGAKPNFLAVLDTVSGRQNVDPELAERIASVREVLLRDDAAPDAPFLSVLLRTQGRRIEPLKDALLCLQGQSDQDFEVIVLMHDALPDDAEDVRRVIERQPPSLRARIRLEQVDGGSRARPLNVGLAAARGRYISVFDDDDLLFAHWVETFRRSAETSPGRMVRALVANQAVEPELWPHGQDGFRTLSWPKAEYPESFDQLEHLLVNYSPFMSWAFPRTLFSLYGVRFDEELLVCEDWDVILRGSLLCGVDDMLELTAIYRRWQGGASSYSSHSAEEWRASEERVIERIDQSVIMMPPGTMRSARHLVGYAKVLESYRFLFRGNQLRFPLNVGWRAATPAVKLAVRARDKLRRMRGSR